MKFSVWIWIPRSVLILYIAFISLFSLDSFSTDLPFGEQLVAFLMHSIPSLILIVLLVLTWKRPLWAGLGTLIIATGSMIFFGTYNHLNIFMFITLPLLLIGVSFIIFSLFIKDKE